MRDEAIMDWPIQHVARLAGTTSRTLRHYGDVGLLAPTRLGSNGYRYYDATALVRLQRILLLRQLGLGLSAIAEVIDGQRDDATALVTHLRWLRAERDRVDAQIASVETTITALNREERLMAEEMLDGFDHAAYRREVEQRWGAEAYAVGDRWWSSKTPEEKRVHQQRQAALAQAWADAAGEPGADPAGAQGQALALRHYEWLSGIPGTPGYPDGPTPEYLVGLGEMYVADERFAANYGGPVGAAFVRDALAAFAAARWGA
jgi:DNA-binding transcriptional MerR regulator